MASSSFSNKSSSPPLSDFEWEIIEDDEFYSMSGVFCPSPANNSQSLFIPFKPKSNSFLNPSSSSPVSYSISSSSNGLILSRGPWSSYSISNPSTGSHVLLPKPPCPHNPSSPLSLLVTSSTYRVVSAIPRTHIGSYTFSTFSSSSGNWAISKNEYELAPIIPNTCASCGGSAYWRTEDETLAVYNVLDDKARILMPPVTVLKDGWQIGRAGENLCCVVVTRSNMEVYELGMKDRWILVCSIGISRREENGWDGGEPIVCMELVKPLRFESNALEVLLVVDGDLVVVEFEKRKMRIVELDKGAAGRYDEFVPYVDHPLISADFAVGDQYGDIKISSL